MDELSYSPAQQFGTYEVGASSEKNESSEKKIFIETLCLIWKTKQ